MADIKTLQLQVNTSGAWKTVARFGVGDARAGALARDGAMMLHEADEATAWRLVNDAQPPAVLYRLDRHSGGLWVYPLEDRP